MTELENNPNHLNETLDELEYLQWFYSECDFGPAHDDVIKYMNIQYTEETGKELPQGY